MDRRFGFYLRPSFAMCRAQTEIHDLLMRQYGLHAAGRFMPHATIKGFFKSEAPIARMIERLTEALGGMTSFDVFNNGVVPFVQSAIVLDVNRSPVTIATRRSRRCMRRLCPLCCPSSRPTVISRPGSGSDRSSTPT